MKNAFNDALSQMYEASRPAPNGEPDLVCFSHLRWDFMFSSRAGCINSVNPPLSFLWNAPAATEHARKCF